MARGTQDDTPTPVGSSASEPAPAPVLDATTLHEVTDFALRLRARLDQLTSPAARPVWAMSADELSTALLELTRATRQLDAVRLAVLAEADRNGHVAGPGDRSAADWLARETRTRRAAARADLRLAQSLDTTLHTTATAMADGTVSVEQARTIARSLDRLPETGEFAVTYDQRANAEAHLADLAHHHDPDDLDLLGRRVYAVISPEHADAYEGRLLEAEEARAARKTSLESWTDHQGITHGRFAIPKLHGAMLKKALDAIMSPLRETTGPADTSGSDEQQDRRPMPVRRGEAFCELLERLAARDLPTAAGGDATIVVTLDLDTLTDVLDAAGVATLDTGHRISAAEVRRLACHHRLVPAVLDTTSQVLDLGRTQRLHTKAQRLAMAVRDRGCTAEHCDVPAAKCHAHHDTPWSEGGTTDVVTGRLLCGPHHRRVHDPAFLHEKLPDGALRFHRRP